MPFVDEDPEMREGGMLDVGVVYVPMVPLSFTY